MSAGPNPPKNRVLEEFASLSRKLSCGCLEWIGPTKRGYPYFRYRGKLQPATKLAYRWFKGPFASGRVIDHRCAHTLCVWNEHLEAVTVTENSRRGNRPLDGAPACRQIHVDGVILTQKQPWFVREEPSIPREGESVLDWVRRMGRAVRAMEAHHADIQRRLVNRCFSAIKRSGIREPFEIRNSDDAERLLRSAADVLREAEHHARASMPGPVRLPRPRP